MNEETKVIGNKILEELGFVYLGPKILNGTDSTLIETVEPYGLYKTSIVLESNIQIVLYVEYLKSLDGFPNWTIRDDSDRVYSQNEDVEDGVYYVETVYSGDSFNQFPVMLGEILKIYLML